MDKTDKCTDFNSTIMYFMLFAAFLYSHSDLLTISFRNDEKRHTESAQLIVFCFANRFYSYDWQIE